MQLETHYLNLLDALNPGNDGERTPVTLERLSSAFRCTERNAKFVLRKMEEAGWIAWHPGRGRGRTSEIELVADRERVLEDVARRLAEQGDVRGALRLMQDRSRLPESAERFSAWLTDFFGYSREDRLERTLDTLRVPVYDQILSFDPSKIYYVIESHLCRQLFDTLVKYDPVREDVVASLAHHWESNEDGSRWTVYVRKGVWFHHKRELDASDVVFTFERLEGHPHFGLIERVCAAGAHVVEFVLKEPCVWFPRLLGFDSASILPKDLVEARGSGFFDIPVGTGPFQIARLTDRLCVLDAFPQYFQGRAHLDRVELHFITSDDDLHTMPISLDLVQKGACGVPLGAAGEQYARLRTSTNGSCRLLTFNLRRPGPQQNPKFRQAISELIDREDLLARIADDRLRVANGFIADEADGRRLPAPDPDRIRALLRASGYDGSPLIIDSNANREKETRLICEYAKAYGVALEPRFSRHCDFHVYANREPGHIVFYNVVMEQGEATFIDFVFSPSSAVGMHLLDDEHLEAAAAIIRRMYREPTPAGRWRCIAELSDRIRASHAIAFLFHSAFDAYFDPKIGGVHHNSLGMIDFRHIWFKVANARAVNTGSRSSRSG
ncbi:MAG TPA: ABC transporter substrate-binding protein [Paenibacillus sp.]|nr:ABC transporter substrate-binding protein [Paenibacillus sp.]